MVFMCSEINPCYTCILGYLLKMKAKAQLATLFKRSTILQVASVSYFSVSLYASMSKVLFNVVSSGKKCLSVFLVKSQSSHKAHMKNDGGLPCPFVPAQMCGFVQELTVLTYHPKIWLCLCNFVLLFIDQVHFLNCCLKLAPCTAA